MSDNQSLSPTEVSVAAIWINVLGRDEGSIGPNDSFTELGGDSMLMMMALFQVRERFGVSLEPTALLEAPVLRGFCKHIDEAMLAAKMSNGVNETRDSADNSLVTGVI